MGKIEFIEERCFGCGACWSVAPENFTCNDEGRTTMISDKVNEAAIEASEICPASAIIVEGNCECECCECENCNCSEETNECNCKHECTCGENCNCTDEDNCGCLDKCTCNDDCNCTDECNCGCK